MPWNKRWPGNALPPTRRPEPPTSTSRLWPVALAALLLAACVAAIVVAVGQFDEPRLLHNGWAWLASVGVMAALLLAGPLLFHRKTLRRLQFCVLLSLLVHLAAIVYMHRAHLVIASLPGFANREEFAREPENVVPDYFWRQLDEPEVEQAFERPVESRPVEQQEQAENRPADIARHREAERPFPVVKKPEFEPKPAADSPINPVEIRRAELSVPRRAEEAAGGQISRHEMENPREPSGPIPQPVVMPADRQLSKPLQSPFAPLLRQPTQALALQRRRLAKPSLATDADRFAAEASHNPVPTAGRQFRQPDHRPKRESANRHAGQRRRRPGAELSCGWSGQSGGGTGRCGGLAAVTWPKSGQAIRRACRDDSAIPSRHSEDGAAIGHTAAAAERSCSRSGRASGAATTNRSAACRGTNAGRDRRRGGAIRRIVCPAARRGH